MENIASAGSGDKPERRPRLTQGTEGARTEGAGRPGIGAGQIYMLPGERRDVAEEIGRQSLRLGVQA